MRDDLGESWLTLGSSVSLPERPAEDALLDLDTLVALGESLAQLTAESARVVRFEAPVAGRSGELNRREVMRAGAFAAFSEGLKRVPDSVDTRDALAQVYASQGRLREAVAEWQAVLRLDPDHPPGLLRRSARPGGGTRRRTELPLWACRPAAG